MSPSPPSDALPLFKKRNAKKATHRKRPATPPSAAESDSEYSSADESGQRIKRRKKTGGLLNSSKTAPGSSVADALSASSRFAADRSATIAETNDATRQSNWYEKEGPLDAKSLLGTTRARALAPRAGDGEAPAEDGGNYKGTAAYGSFIRTNPDAAAGRSKAMGPVKAPTNIRTITVTDYSPDVCKDYKQTGFCGFGDNCKFLHAREDYKQGWQLDKEWENVTKGKKVVGGTVVGRRTVDEELDEEEEEDRLLEGIPFACIICKEAYKFPVVTKCGHYFCEACALKRYRKTPSCAACGTGTGGVFNGAKNLKKMLEKKRERAARRREKARENGEEASEDEDEEAVEGSDRGGG